MLRTLIDIVRPMPVRHIGLVASIAAGQDRLVRRDQLLRARLTRHDIQALLQQGVLIPVLWGVYLVGVPTLANREFLRAALLYGGPGSQLSHRTAGEVGELLRPRLGLATVTTPRRGLPSTVMTKVPVAETGKRGTIRFECRANPAPPTWVDGLAVSPLPRALTDIAEGSDGDRVLGWAWREAEYRGLLDLAAIQEELGSRSNRPGVPIVRAKLATHRRVLGPDDGVRSRKELDFLHLIEAHGLPKPEVNVRLLVGADWSRPDYFWRLLRLALEFDGPGHLRPGIRADDVLSDAECFVEDIDVLRFTTERALADPVHHIGLLRRALERKSRQLGIPLGALPQFAS